MKKPFALANTKEIQDITNTILGMDGVSLQNLKAMDITKFINTFYDYANGNTIQIQIHLY